jgi:hypothetical protein
MSPSEAARTAAHGRRLRAAHILTVYDCAVLDTMLWRLRRPGRADFTADYDSIVRLSGVKRTAAIGAVRKLAAIGLLQKITRRIRVAWGRGSVASRQIANAYVFRVPDTESAPRPAEKGLVRIQEDSACERALRSLAVAFGVPLPAG